MTHVNRNRRAKIVCTIGPSSGSYEKIKILVEAGMDVARLNFSHGAYDEHKTRISYIRKLSKEVGKPIAILQDLQGPKIRVQKFENDFVELIPGHEFTLTTRELLGNEEIVSVSYGSFHKDVKEGDAILLNDGLLRLGVLGVDGQDVRCKVIHGGRLSNKKGINLPGSILSVSALTDKDKEDLYFGLDNDVDYVALSFVQKPDDIKEIKALISQHGKNTPVVAKIEKPQAVDAIDEITDIVDAIMIARGDLGVEVNVEEVPPLQKEIIRLCNDKGIPVITATQMLESMITNPYPTRAEASDVANAIVDGTDAVMLSGETAAGSFPVESVQIMQKIVALTEQKNYSWLETKRRKPGMQYTTPLAIGYCASHAADLVDARAIVCLTQSGSTAKMISKYRPERAILAVSPNYKTVNQMALCWGVTSYYLPSMADDFDNAVDKVREFLKSHGLAKSGEKIILTAGLPFHMYGITNMVRIEEI